MKKQKNTMEEKANAAAESQTVVVSEKQEVKQERAEMPKKETQVKSNRIISIDRFRGLCMFIMVISFMFNAFGETFASWSPLFEHGADGFQILPGIAFADIFAPMFIFVIGLTYVKSFKSREEKYGTKRAYLQTALRYLGLIGIGACLNGFEDCWGNIIKQDGWVDSWAQVGLNFKIFGICFCIAGALLIVLLISKLVKSDKFKKVASYMFRTFLALVGVIALFLMIAMFGGYAGGVDVSFLGAYPCWDTLQNIGLAGLVALPFVKFSKWGKFIMVAIAFTVMTILGQYGNFRLAEMILEGGLIGSVGWAGILLLGSVFFELKDKKSQYWVTASLMMLLSIVLIVTFGFTAHKQGGTPVYALFCASLAAMVFAGIDALNKYQLPKFAFFSWWGGSALFTYAVNYAVYLAIGLIVSVIDTVVPIWLGIIVIIVMLALYSVMNWLLYRKGKHIRL